VSAAEWVETAQTVEERAARGRRVYARNLGLGESGMEFAMSGLAGRTFVREAYLAAGGPDWHGQDLSDRDRALVVIAALVGQHVTDERLEPGHDAGGGSVVGAAAEVGLLRSLTPGTGGSPA
jgi:hypothetical protein